MDRLTRPVIWLTALASLGSFQPLQAQHSLSIKPADLIVAGVPDRAEASDVERLLGRPDSVTRGDDPSESSGNLAAWWYRDLEILFLGDGELLGSWIRGPSRSTSRGLRVGQSRRQAQMLYGTPLERGTDTTATYVLEQKEGTPRVIVYFSKGRVSSIYIGSTVE